MKSGIHAASIDSPRLKPIYDLLVCRGQKGATSIELQQAANCTSVSACVSELRARGIRIECEHVRDTASGRSIYRYTLVPKGELF